MKRNEVEQKEMKWNEKRQWDERKRNETKETKWDEKGRKEIKGRN